MDRSVRPDGVLTGIAVDGEAGRVAGSGVGVRVSGRRGGGGVVAGLGGSAVVVVVDTATVDSSASTSASEGTSMATS